MEKVKIMLLPGLFVTDDGLYDMDGNLLLAGKYAGVCYNKESFDKLLHELEEKTWKRVERTLVGGHHSVYGHVHITLYLENIPKIVAMAINNEHEYNTSEKSARYTPLKGLQEDSLVTGVEVELYHKWLEIFKMKIKSCYGAQFDDKKIEKLAQENARYMVSVFMPTQMVYTTSFRQLNYLASFMKRYISEAHDKFSLKVAYHMQEFLDVLQEKNLLLDELMLNDKNRKFTLFGNHLDLEEEYFGHVYNTTYLGSWAELGQAQRHRTLYYQMERLQEKQYFIPPILEDDSMLVAEWLTDMERVSFLVPQGELIKIVESGRYEHFILKCKERLCSAAQLEIARQTKDTLNKYQEALAKKNSYLYDNLQAYSHGARCTFPDYTCSMDCQFKEGKTLVRKI